MSDDKTPIEPEFFPSDEEATEKERFSLIDFLREQRWWVLAAVLLVTVAAVSFTLYRNEARRQRALNQGGAQTAEQLLAAGGEKTSVEVYFRSPDTDMSAGRILVLQSKQILKSASLSGRARQIVLALVEGPDGSLRPVLPPETKVRQVYTSRDGLAVVDLSKEARELLIGGVDAETSAVYAITHSLNKNIPAIRHVRILIEGKEAATLAGHLSLREAFEPDPSLVALEKVASRESPVASR